MRIILFDIGFIKESFIQFHKGNKSSQCQIRSISERRIDSYQSRINKINRGLYQCEFQDKRDRILEQKKRSTFFSNSINLIFSTIRNLAIDPYRARKHFLGAHVRLYVTVHNHGQRVSMQHSVLMKNSKKKTLVLYIESIAQSNRARQLLREYSLYSRRWRSSWLFELFLLTQWHIVDLFH